MLTECSATCMRHDYVTLRFTGESWTQKLVGGLERVIGGESTLTILIKEFTTSITKLVGEEGIEKAMDLTDCPKLCIESGAIHGCLPQDTGFAVD